MKFSGHITEDGNIMISDRNGWAQFKSDNIGQQITLNIRAGGKRSTNANAYLWGVCYPNIIEAMKQDGTRINAEQLHGYFCQLFIGVTLPDANGEAVTLPGRSSQLGRKEFGEFIEAVVMWAWEKLNIVIPEPLSQTELKLSA